MSRSRRGRADESLLWALDWWSRHRADRDIDDDAGWEAEFTRWERAEQLFGPDLTAGLYSYLQTRGEFVCQRQHDPREPHVSGLPPARKPEPRSVLGPTSTSAPLRATAGLTPQSTGPQAHPSAVDDVNDAICAGGETEVTEPLMEEDLFGSAASGGGLIDLTEVPSADTRTARPPGHHDLSAGVGLIEPRSVEPADPTKPRRDPGTSAGASAGEEPAIRRNTATASRMFLPEIAEAVHQLRVTGIETVARSSGGRTMTASRVKDGPVEPAGEIAQQLRLLIEAGSAAADTRVKTSRAVDILPPTSAMAVLVPELVRSVHAGRQAPEPPAAPAVVTPDLNQREPDPALQRRRRRGSLLMIAGCLCLLLAIGGAWIFLHRHEASNDHVGEAQVQDAKVGEPGGVALHLESSWPATIPFSATPASASVQFSQFRFPNTAVRVGFLFPPASV